jgi:hypothetical protein
MRSRALTLALLLIAGLATAQQGPLVSAPGTLEVVIEKSGTRVNIALAEAAYLKVRVPPVAELDGLALYADIQTMNGDKLGRGSARIDAAGRYQILFHQAYGNAQFPTPPIAVMLETEIILDFNEPNDTIETATPLVAFDWTTVQQYPAGDIDIFSIHLPIDANLIVDRADLPSAINMEVYNQDDQQWQQVGSRYVPAGDHLLRLRRTFGDATAEPVPLRYRWLPAPVPADASTVAIGQVTKIPVPLSGRPINVDIPVEEAGLYRFQIGGAIPRSAVMSIEGAGQSPHRGTVYEKHLMPGTHSLRIGSDAPSLPEGGLFLLVNQYPPTAENEPNDTPAMAKSLRVDELIRVALFPSRDVDWYQVGNDVTGPVYVELSGAVPGSHRLSVESSPTADASQATALAQVTSKSALLYGPVNPGDYVIFKSQRDEADLIGFSATLRSGEMLPTEQQRVFFVGVDLDDETASEFAAVAAVVGVPFASSKPGGSVDAALDELTDKNFDGSDNLLTRLAIGAVLLLILIVVAGVWRRSRRRR